MLVFLKLGGSLITDKNHPHTARKDVINRLADEVNQSLKTNPGLSILLAHGSGSFGHVPAKKFGTRDGVRSKEQWSGFVEVWQEAHSLNQIVLDIFSHHGLPVITFPPSAMIISKNKQLDLWNFHPIQAAINAGLLPVVFGDVIFDSEIGATVFSTEELFIYMSHVLKPDRILIAGMEEGVWQYFPVRKHLIKKINHLTDINSFMNVGPSQSVDVTGGMLEKVNLMKNLIIENKKLVVNIFSGLIPNNLAKCLSGGEVGTTICY
jgi:isopentenyl phosphate kinase